MKMACTLACLGLLAWPHVALGANETAAAAVPAEAKEGTTPTPAPARDWDAVLGLIASYAPEYAGSSRWSAGLKPGGWVRIGRFSLASRSVFVVRSGEPVSGGGLRVDLSPNELLRIGLSLRHDGGRQESDSADLQGLGDVRPTVRMRLGASYPLSAHWRAGASLSIDALGRGGGTLADINVGRSFPLAERTSAHIGAALSLGNRRYMRAYYGVNEEQAQRSGYPVYEPGAGTRDLSLSMSVRHEIAAQWVAFAGISAAHLVGPAAASPLVRQPSSWALNAGLGYRF